MQALYLILCLVLISKFTQAHICLKGRASRYEPSENPKCGYSQIPQNELNLDLLTKGVAIQQRNGWKKGEACGMCYEISGPSSVKPQIFMVTDLCRESNKWCTGKDGIFHVAMPESTSWPIIAKGVNATAVYTKFKLVACPVEGNIKLQVVRSSNSKRFGLRPFNHRYGVKSVEVKEAGGKFVHSKRDTHNVFWYESKSDEPKFPVTLRLISSRNQKIQYSLSEIGSGIITTNQQFPPSDKKTSHCMPFVDQIVFSDGLSKGKKNKTVAQDWRPLYNRDAIVNYEARDVVPRTGSKSIRAQFAKNGTFALGTVSGISTKTVKGIRFYVQSEVPVTGLSFFVVALDGRVSKSMPVSVPGNATWTKQFFDFSTYIPDWKSFKGLGFSSEDASPIVHIDDIWLYLKNDLRVVSSDTILTVNE